MTAQEILIKTKKLKVSLWSEGDKLKYKAPEGVLTDEMRANIQRHKNDLLELLARDDPTGAASAAATPTAPDALPDVPGVPTFAAAAEFTAASAAAAILAGAYFNLARGGVWCIGWQQPSRAAWQWACLENGGTLDGATGTPSMDAQAAIDWAKQQQQNEVTA